MDASDLDRLVRGQLAAALRFATRLCGDPDAAEEIVQQSLFQAARGWRSFRGDSSFRSWFFRIIVNVSRDRSRSARADQELVDDPVDARAADPPGQLIDQEIAREIAREVSRLPDRQREVLVLVAYENHSISEAATVLETNEQNVRTNLHLARRRLRERLARHLPAHWTQDAT
ncbi:MAG TPA: sigma-70 family RNA polymerase sigma factor [Humisphaera sp.]|nr:sigma-70 family RNA polymerase sigma factor [Humisphaera sp.]